MSKISEMDPRSLVDPSFLGVPYKLGGRSFDGADCVGLVCLYLGRHGVDCSDVQRWGRQEMEHWYERAPSRFLNAVLEFGKPVGFAEVRKFDLLLFFGSRAASKFPTGMGIMVDSRHFLSVLRESDISSVHMLNIRWKAMIWGVVRIKRVVQEGLSSWV